MVILYISEIMTAARRDRVEHLTSTARPVTHQGKKCNADMKPTRTSHVVAVAANSNAELRLFQKPLDTHRGTNDTHPNTRHNESTTKVSHPTL